MLYKGPLVRLNASFPWFASISCYKLPEDIRGICGTGRAVTSCARAYLIGILMVHSEITVDTNGKDRVLIRWLPRCVIVWAGYSLCSFFTNRRVRNLELGCVRSVAVSLVRAHV